MAAADAPTKPVDFNREIRPILSDTCFTCHGPDEKLRPDAPRHRKPEAQSGSRQGHPAAPGQLRLDRAAAHPRDHHPKCFTMWMAGGGIKPGISIGQTDDYCYNVVEDPVPIHDLQAIVLHSLGVDHTKLTFKFQGRYFRLTDVAGNVVTKVLA